MATLIPVSMSFEEISDLTLSPETLLASVNQNFSCWQSVICYIANDISIYPQILQENTDLWSQVEYLESTNEQFVQAQNQVQQNIEEKHIYKQKIQNLMEQFHQAYVNGPLAIYCMAKSATHPNPEKFNSDKTKLEVFLAQLNLKLKCNIDHFTRTKQNTEQNKLSYAILHLEEDVFVQIEPYISTENINFKNIN